MLALATLSGAAAAPASANSVHLYETTWNMPSGSKPTAQAVDNEGNLYVFNQGTSTVSRYDSNGNPAPFSALGTNLIDGKGGFDCPSTPSDCDRVPLNEFVPAGGYCYAGCAHPLTVAVNTASGPTEGYIYVENGGNGQGGSGAVPYPNARTEVFAPTGKYLGEIKTNGDSPKHIGNFPATVNVDQNGNVYLEHGHYGQPTIIDKYTPVDTVPEHDVFAGQLRNEFEASDGQGGMPYSYMTAYTGPFGPIWAYDEPQYYTVNRDNKPFFASDPLPFAPAGPGEAVSANQGRWTGITIDPATGHLYLRVASTISEWDGQGHQVGNDFGPPYVSTYETRQIEGTLFSTAATENLAVDGSATATRGRLYVQGAQNEEDSIAVFSPPKPTPDIEYGEASVSHDTAQINGEVTLAGGPPVTECKLEWGTTVFGYERKPLPCGPAVPYGEDQAVSISMSNLPTEQKIHYRIAATNVNGTSYGERREIQPHAVLDLKTDAASNITPNTATLNASMNPDGIDTAYYFEFGIDTNYGTKSEQRDAPSATSGESVPGITVSKLQPGFIYHYRAVAVNALGTTYGPDRTFTPSSPPRISAVRARNVTPISADLHASIDAVGSPTEYRFDYGPTRDYGKSTPTQELPADAENVPVSAHIEGLESGVTTYFRVVATNGNGTRVGEDTSFSFFPPECPNSHVRQQTGANYLPDCRAYEFVSPPNPGSAYLLPGDSVFDAFQGFPGPIGQEQYPVNSGFPGSPSRFNFWSANSNLPGVESPNFVTDMYVATRSNEGWNTVYPAPKSDEVFLVGNEQCADDLSLCLSRPTVFMEGGGTKESNAPFLFDATTGRNLGRLPTNVGAVKDGYGFEGEGHASGDFTHFVFSSRNVPFAPGGLTEAPGSVYDNNIDRDTVEIVSKLPSGEPIPQNPGSVGNSEDYLDIPFISTDGSRILIGARTEPHCSSVFFCTGDRNTPMQLYMRTGGVTYSVSRDHTVHIADVAQDGRIVYFTSSEQLVPADQDTSVDLYRWQLATDELDVLSIGIDGSGQQDDCSVSWTKGCGVVPLRSCDAVWTLDMCSAKKYGFPTERPDIDSGTGRTSGATLFYSPEQLDPENPGIAEARNLYLYRNGKPQYVTTFDPGTEAERYNVTPDGRYVAFVTRARLTAYNNLGGSHTFCNRNISRPRGQTDAYDPGEVNVLCREVYRFDADTGTIRCVSCSADGTPPAGDALAAMGGPFMADDGRVFFTTRDALVPTDTDSMYSVYEYVDGHAQLISSGISVEDHFPGLDDTVAFGPFYDPAYAGLESVSADGRDVFFSTYDTLVPTDRVGKFLKFYDARTNGGFPYQVPLLPCEAADECHSATQESPVEPQVGSGANLVGGNLQPQKAKRVRRKHHSKKHRRPAKRRRTKGRGKGVHR
jgi:hypothetical protein